MLTTNPATAPGFLFLPLITHTVQKTTTPHFSYRYAMQVTK